MEIIKNSVFADFARALWSLLQETGRRFACAFGWHTWKTYRELVLFGPQTVHDCCIHCGRERYGSKRLMTTPTPTREDDAS